MPRKKSNAREMYKRKRIKIKPNVRLVWIKDDGMRPGRIVAAAEYINN